MSKPLKLFSYTLAVGLLSATVGFAADYAEGPVGDGGTIAGKVAFKGPQPPPEMFDLAKFPQADFCGKVDSKDGKRMRQDVKVKDGGLADVVVFIEKIAKGKPFPAGAENTKMVADGCRFLIDGGPSKAVGVVLVKDSGKKGVLKVTNNDADPSDPKTAEGVLHNPHGYDVKGSMNSTIFNKPVPKKGQTLDIEVLSRWFKKSESFMKVECDQHNYMNAWALPVDNPYYAIVSDDGSFSIDQVPPGKYTVKAFHPALGFQKSEIEVAAKGKATANFEFSK
jgi:hypothetical protein